MFPVTLRSSTPNASSVGDAHQNCNREGGARNVSGGIPTHHRILRTHTCIINPSHHERHRSWHCSIPWVHATVDCLSRFRNRNSTMAGHAGHHTDHKHDRVQVLEPHHLDSQLRILVCSEQIDRKQTTPKKIEGKKKAIYPHRRSLVTYTRTHDLPACDMCLHVRDRLIRKTERSLLPF